MNYLQHKHSEKIYFLILVLVAGFFNIYNYNFPFGYHIDEGKKVTFLEEGRQDFHHPVLMLQLLRFGDKFNPAKTKQARVEIGRFISGCMGLFMTVFVYLIFRKLLERPYSWLAGLAVATSPILVVHAHYLKEDVYFTCFAYLSLLALFRYLRKSCNANVVMLGAAVGLALSSHYKGALLFPLLLAVPLLVKIENIRRYYLHMLSVFGLMLIVFGLVNYTSFGAYTSFLKGIGVDVRNVMGGQDIKLYPWTFFFSFHLIYSLGPGMTWPVLILSIAGLGYALYRWRTIESEARILAAFGILYYLAVELTPMKSFPDYYRYVIPVAPALIFFMFRLAQDLKPIKRLSMAALIVCSLSVAYAAYDGFQLVHHLDKDTRQEAQLWMRKSKQSVMCERYVFPYSFIRSLGEYDVYEWRARKFRYLVASSFQYERYFFAGKLKGQAPDIYKYRERYEEIFKYPHWEIKPKYRSFAFSNPTIRIIDIRFLQ